MLLWGAVAWDLRTRRIPNGLTLAGLAAGLAWHGIRGGGPGLLLSGEGVAVATLALLPYAVRGLGAGDVKLLGAVGALAGPAFALWTLLGAMVAGGLLALLWAAGRGALRLTVVNAFFGLRLLRAGASLAPMAEASQVGRMPLAPAIALGAVFAYVKLQGGWVP